MNKIFKAILIFNFSLLIINSANAQFTHQDTLRGSNGLGRDWWDVMAYKIQVTPDYNAKSIIGSNEITFKVTKQPKNGMVQIDLQQSYLSEQSGKDLSKIFDQYLRTTMIPALEYKFTGDNMYYRWTNCVAGFNMPVKLNGSGDDWLKVTTEWKTVAATADILKDGLKIDRNFYITVKRVE